jgi:hypothetical protein
MFKTRGKQRDGREGSKKKKEEKEKDKLQTSCKHSVAKACIDRPKGIEVQQVP